MDLEINCKTSKVGMKIQHGNSCSFSLATYAGLTNRMVQLFVVQFSKSQNQHIYIYIYIYIYLFFDNTTILEENIVV